MIPPKDLQLLPGKEVTYKGHRYCMQGMILVKTGQDDWQPVVCYKKVGADNPVYGRFVADFCSNFDYTNQEDLPHA